MSMANDTMSTTNLSTAWAFFVAELRRGALAVASGLGGVIALLLVPRLMPDAMRATSEDLRLAVALAGIVLVLPLLLRRLLRLPLLASIARDARTALLGTALPVQFATSVAVVGSYLAVFVLAARCVGVDTPAWALLPLVGPVLVTMLVPVTVAGWGLREGAAGALWVTAGLSPADGVAISVAYGLLVLASSAPGAVLLALIPLGRAREDSGDPGRRAGRPPVGSGAPGPVSPPGGGGSPEG